jgi:hypothetical protein
MPLVVLAVCLACLAPAAACPDTASAHRVQRGLIDESWVCAAPQEQQRILHELADRLHVQVVRIACNWRRLEPQQGTYDVAYLSQLSTAVRRARGVGLRVMVIVCSCPRWASDAAFWNDPPGGYSPGYQPFYPVDRDALDDWGATACLLATTLRGDVDWWECWCEPNMWSYLYPQRTPSDSRFAARRYTLLLKRFRAGIKRGDPGAKVLGGVTSPVGANDALRTSPQRFARQLRSFGAQRYMDGYSHHPYTPGPRVPMPGPEAWPRFPRYTVSLGNIRVLLRIFPGLPFYLSEYGYTTHPSAPFGGAAVSERRQAAYLRRAYRFADRFPQIRMLTWYLRQDVSPSGQVTDENGFYFGLSDIHGARKPSWYAYAALRRR